VLVNEGSVAALERIRIEGRRGVRL
jgi:hypothetical protein